MFNITIFATDIPLKGIELPMVVDDAHDERAAFLLHLQASPKNVFSNIVHQRQYPSFEDYIKLCPAVLETKNPQKIYQFKCEQALQEKKYVNLPTKDIDIDCGNKLHECETSYCPYFRYGPLDLRSAVADVIEKKLSSETLALLKEPDDSPLVITSFASGALLQDLIVMQRLSQNEYIRACRIEFNLIDISYKKIIESDAIANSELGQFNGFMHHLFPNITVFIYSTTMDYVEDVQRKQRPSSHIVWSVDFGIDAYEYIICNLNLLFLNYAAGAQNHLEFRFPYQPAGSYIAYYQGSLDNEEKKLVISKCLRMIDTVLNAPGYSAFDAKSEYGKIIYDEDAALKQIIAPIKVDATLNILPTQRRVRTWPLLTCILI